MNWFNINRQSQSSGYARACGGLIAIACWFALIAQFRINISSRVAPPAELVIRYFSYFTIITNLLVAICFSALAFFRSSWLGRFFAQQQTLTAVTVYIITVGVIYNLILRFIWNPQGLQKVVDELLHSFVPAAVTAYWAAFSKKELLSWNDFWRWLIYPLSYAAWIFVRGAISGFYPYPFLDVNKLGASRTAINVAALSGFLILVSLMLIFIGRFVTKKKNSVNKPYPFTDS